MHLKLLITLSLVTVGLALPEPISLVKTVAAGLQQSSKQNYYFSSFGIFYKGVSESLQLPYRIFKGISQKKTQPDLDACFDVIISAATASAGILDNKYSGVYDIYTSLLLGISRGLLCTNVWTDNFKSKICKRTYGKELLGFSKYTGDYDQFSSVIDYYSLYESKSQLQTIVRKKSGKDVNSLTGTEKVVFTSMFELLKLQDRNRSYLRKNGLKLFYQHVTTIVAALANSHKRGLGHQVATEMGSYCGETFQGYGYDISSVYSSYIKVQLDITTKESFYNALIVDNDDDDDDTNTANDDTSNNDGDSDTGDSNDGNDDRDYKRTKGGKKNTTNDKRDDTDTTDKWRNKKASGREDEYQSQSQTETDKYSEMSTKSKEKSRNTYDQVKQSKKPQKCTCVDQD